MWAVTFYVFLLKLFYEKTILILLLAGLVNLTGCTAKAPTFGDSVLSEAESRIEIAEQYEQGGNDAGSGEKKIRNERKSVKKGRSDLREGEPLIDSGNTQAQSNSQACQSLSQTAQGIASA